MISITPGMLIMDAEDIITPRVLMKGIFLWGRMPDLPSRLFMSGVKGMGHFGDR